MSDKCCQCNHINVCGVAMRDYDGENCQYNEPKREKCEDCIVGHYSTTDGGFISVYESELPLNYIEFKNDYCPKCGTWIEVK